MLEHLGHDTLNKEQIAQRERAEVSEEVHVQAAATVLLAQKELKNVKKDALTIKEKENCCWWSLTAPKTSRLLMLSTVRTASQPANA